MDIQGTLISLVTFVVVLSLVVSVHEFGHFQVGRWCGVAAKSFSIGWGGELFGWTDKHGTRWKISQIPIGGFVSWVDDVEASSTKPNEEFAHLSDAEARKRGHLRAMPVGVRAAVAAAGPAFNFLLSIFLFALLMMIVGRDVPTVSTVSPNSPAAEAGFHPGDRVLSVNGAETDDFRELQSIVSQSPDQQLTIIVSRDGADMTLLATPRLQPVLDASGAPVMQNGAPASAVMLGLGHDSIRDNFERVDPITALGFGVEQTWMIIAGTADYIGGIFTGKNGADGIAGPVGIFNQSGQVANAALSVPDLTLGERIFALALNLMSWAALLSVGIGFANLLPIPVLDGGHLVMYAIEALRGGKPLPGPVQQWAFNVGVVMIVGLFLFATWNDISRHLLGAQG